MTSTANHQDIAKQSIPLWDYQAPGDVRSTAFATLSQLSGELEANGASNLSQQAHSLAQKARVRFKPPTPNAIANFCQALLAHEGLSAEKRLEWGSYLMALAACYGDAIARKVIAALMIESAAQLSPNQNAWVALTLEVSLDASDPWTDALEHWQMERQRCDSTGPDTPREPASGAPNTFIVAPDMSIGEEDSSVFSTRDLDALLARYQPLSRPLPLQGNFELDDMGQFAIVGQLREEFPWFGSVIDTLDEQMVLRHAMGTYSLGFRPLLLVGLPGCGKTRFATRLAQLSGCAYGAINAGGSSDNRLLAGTARGWATATPCLPAAIMVQNRCANPVILVDEIDKTSTDPRNGRLVHTLLSMLEPMSAKAWPDECLVTPLDLSHVSWIVTANSLEYLESPLISRFDVHYVAPPQANHFDALLATILEDIAQDFHQDVAALPILTADVINRLRAGFERDRSPRALRRAVSVSLAQALRRPSLLLN